MNSKIVHRMKIARGHLDKVIRMIETDQYCIDILTQSQAVQAALKEVDAIVLEDHLRTCVADAIKGTQAQQNQSIAEVVKVFKKKS